MVSTPNVSESVGLVQDLLERADKLESFVRSKVESPSRCAIVVEDILQEVWMAAFRGFSTFRYDGPESFDRWLYTIARNKIYDCIKSAKSAKRDDDRLQRAVRNSGSFCQLVDVLAASQRTPSRVASSRETFNAVRIALSSLSDQQQRAIRLVYMEGKNTIEAASVMNVTRGAVRGHLWRGLHRMRVLLGSASSFTFGSA